ncbi:MAG: autoinducer binding domain-containing protein, partial [Chitinimonas sp.]|nr:autoinducer binding domain-containing protein [Chitinimonas sp.]
MLYLEKYQSLISASTEAEALQQLSHVASQYGYDSLLLAAVPTPGQPLETAYLRSTYDTAWRETY